MTDPGQPLLKVKNLAVRFATPRGEVRAVEGVDLEVTAGEIVGLVGESGSGKSVTLRAITRILRPNASISGIVHWRGQDITQVSERELGAIRGRQIGMIFQEPMTALNPVLSVGQQIDESLVLLGRLDKVGRRRRALELLDLVGIASGPTRLKSYPHELSGGMRQRAMIAIALATEPALLLADEPTTALDVTIQDQILELLTRLCSELGMAMLLVTHDLGVVAETCERVCVMYAGRVVESGPATELFANPRHAYTHALVRSMPGAGLAHQPLVAIPGQPPRLDRRIVGCAFAPRCTYCEERCGRETPRLTAIDARRASACFAANRLAAIEVLR